MLHDRFTPDKCVAVRVRFDFRKGLGGTSILPRNGFFLFDKIKGASLSHL